VSKTAFADDLIIGVQRSRELENNFTDQIRVYSNTRYMHLRETLLQSKGIGSFSGFNRLGPLSPSYMRPGSIRNHQVVGSKGYQINILDDSEPRSYPLLTRDSLNNPIRLRLWFQGVGVGGEGAPPAIFWLDSRLLSNSQVWRVSITRSSLSKYRLSIRGFSRERERYRYLQ
jgi:hypothetical protein